MSENRIRKARKALQTAVRELEAALVANPLVQDPLMATAQVLEDLGEIVISESRRPKRAGKPPGAKAPPAKKSARPKR